MSEFCKTLPKIFISFASDGLKPYKNTKSLISCKFITTTSAASTLLVCDNAEYIADFIELLKIKSFAVFFTLPVYRAVRLFIIPLSSLVLTAIAISPTILLSYHPTPSTFAVKSIILSAISRRTFLLCFLAAWAVFAFTLTIKYSDFITLTIGTINRAIYKIRHTPPVA